jgi:putative nucleotidyltransferase with HDIG domain
MNNQTIDIEAKKEKNRNFLASIQNLPSIPVVMMEVTNLLGNPNTSAGELGKIISKDQGLVTKILRVANSPLYGLPRKVSTIEFAIVILGFTHIKNIVVALSAFEAFNSKNDERWDKKKFWAHSIMTATVAKKISEDIGYRKSGEAFIAGLLHDLGISVIQRFFHKQFKEIIDLVETQKMRSLNAEEQVMGLHHGEIGQYLAERWNLPESLGETIRHHHKPSESEDHKVVASIVHLADYLTQHFKVADLSWDDEMQFENNIIEILRLGDEQNLNNMILSYEQLLVDQYESIKI